MAFDKQRLLVVIVGSVLTALACAWMLGSRWVVALAILAVFVPLDMVSIGLTRNPARLRNWYLLRRRKPPDENSLVFVAHAQSAVALWFAAIVSLGFVALAIFILVRTPEHWLAAVAVFGFFGLCGAFYTHLLVLRHTAALPPSPNPVTQEKRPIGGD